MFQPLTELVSQHQSADCTQHWKSPSQQHLSVSDTNQQNQTASLILSSSI